MVNTLEVGSRGIIAECMKTAGQVASLFFRDRGIPALRRTVGPLRAERRNGLEQVLASRTENGTVDVYEVLRMRVSAPTGRYITTPGPHSLMGVRDGDGYMKVTSPLRRFNDVLAHWQIKHALLAEKGERASPILFDADWLARAADEISVRELDAKRTESRQQLFWAHSFLLRWMNDPAREKREYDPLRTLKARVVDGPMTVVRTNGFQCTMYVPEIGLNARIMDWPANRPVSMGDEVDVEIAKVSLGTSPILDLRVK